MAQSYRVLRSRPLSPEPESSSTFRVLQSRPLEVDSNDPQQLLDWSLSPERNRIAAQMGQPPAAPPVNQPLTEGTSIQLDPRRLGAVPAQAPRPGLRPSTVPQTRQAGPSSTREAFQDVGISAARGILSVPEASIGVADIVTGGRYGKFLEDVMDFRPSRWKESLAKYYSESQQQANRSVQEAEGLVETAKAALENPTTIAHAVIESVPLTVAGGLVGRGMGMTPWLSRMGPVARAAAGEGLVSAGASAEQARAESPSGTLSARQAALSAASGAATGGLALLGGRLAKALGIADIDTMLAGAVTSRPARRNLVRAVVSVAAAAGNEGLLEELPQSVQEQVAQNLSAGRDPWQDVDQAAVMGALAGGVMGGGAQVGVSTVGATSPSQEFASTQVELPEAQARQIRQLSEQIPDADLAEDGREDAPHVTVKFGLTEDNVEAVREALADEGPIRVTFGEVSVFPDSGNGDVVKVEVESEGLRRLNKKIAKAVPSEDTHPTYQPHATIAYVQPGKGETYAKRFRGALKGQEVELNSVTFSAKDRSKTSLPLGVGQFRVLRSRPLGETAAAAEAPPASQPSAGVEPAPAVSPVEGVSDAIERLYQGTGATPEQVYGAEAVAEGRAVPAFGPGRYYAFSPTDAAFYGQVSEAEGVELQNPYVLDSDEKLDTLLKASKAQVLEDYDERPERVPDATERVQQYLRDQGHDGMVVQVDDETTPRLRELARNDQVVVFEEPQAPSLSERAIARIDTVEQAARRRLKERGTLTGARAGAGLPVEDMADLVLIGAAKIGKGVVRFADWSTEMVRDFGETIRPHLQAIFEQATARARQEFGPRPIRQRTGQPIPAAKPIPDEKILEFNSIKKMPKQLRQDMRDLFKEFGGFERQRRGVQSVARTQAIANEIRLPLERLRPGTALNAEEMSRYADMVATAFDRRKPLLDKIKSGEATDKDKLHFSALTDAATVLTASLRGAVAETGRAMNILKAKSRVLDVGDAHFIERALRAPGFGGDFRRVSEAAVRAGGDPLKQLQELQKRGTMFDRFQAYYYANLLSGLKTHERNIIGNSFNALANLITPLGAAPADAVKSVWTGKPRTVYLGEMKPASVGSMIGFGRGVKNAAYTFRHGFRPSTVEAAASGQFDQPRYEFIGGLANPFNIPSRALEAADEFFRAIAFTQELYAGAYVQARSEGLKNSDAISDRMSEILTATEGPNGELYQQIRSQASRFAARSVFQEEPGPIVRKLLSFKDPSMPWEARAAALFLAPFVKTPSAILRQGAEASPLGFVMRASRQEGRAGSQALGRAILGSIAMTPIAWLAATGRLTGTPPEDAGDREEFYAQGKLSNAVRIGDYWVRYVLFQPFSVPMSAVASGMEVWRQSKKDEDAAQMALAAAFVGAGASLLDQTFLSGMGTFLDAMDDQDRYLGRWLALFSQGFVPFSGMMRGVTQAVDPVYRRPEGIPESIQAITPGLSQRVPARRERFGAEATRYGGPFVRGFWVPQVSKAVEDEVTSTLARLGVQTTTPRARFTVQGEEVELTDEQRDRVVEAIGRERKYWVEQELRSPGFAHMTDEVKKERLEDAIALGSRIVRPAVLRALDEGREFSLEAFMSPRAYRELRRDEMMGLQMLGQPGAPNAVAR